MSGTRMISRANLPCQPSPQHHHPNPTVRVPDPRAPRRCARQRGSGVLAACRRSGTSIFNKRRDGASPFDPYLAVREQGYAVDEVGADGEAETIAEVDALPVAVSAARGPVGDLVSWLLVVGRWFGRWQHHWSRREAHHRRRICRRRNVIRRRVVSGELGSAVADGRGWILVLKRKGFRFSAVHLHLQPSPSSPRNRRRTAPPSPRARDRRRRLRHRR